MSNQEAQPHEARIRRLERTVRIYSFMFWVATGALVMGQLPQSDKRAPSVITAEKFVLVDGQGRHRADLCMDDGEACLLLGDENQHVRTRLAGTDAGGYLLIKELSGEPRVMLGLQEGGEASFSLRGRGKKNADNTWTSPNTHLTMTSEGYCQSNIDINGR